MLERTWSPDDIPLDTPNAARMYDYLLGGYHNFAIDRAAADKIIAINPEAPLVMQANRAFLRRAITFMVQQGIDQFLDLGSGIPTVGNVHEVAERLNPAAHVVYVDSDPVAVRHSNAILQHNPTTVAIQADVRQPRKLLAHRELLRLLDFHRPVGVLLLYLLHFIIDDTSASQLVHVLRTALPAGSYIALSHGTNEHVEPDIIEELEAVYARSPTPVKLRSRAQIAAFLRGMELVPPGLVYAPQWQPEGTDDLFLDDPPRSATLTGVAAKPQPPARGRTRMYPLSMVGAGSRA